MVKGESSSLFNFFFFPFFFLRRKNNTVSNCFTSFLYITYQYEDKKKKRSAAKINMVKNLFIFSVKELKWTAEFLVYINNKKCIALN